MSKQAANKMTRVSVWLFSNASWVSISFDPQAHFGRFPSWIYFLLSVASPLIPAPRTLPLKIKVLALLSVALGSLIFQVSCWKPAAVGQHHLSVGSLDSIRARLTGNRLEGGGGVDVRVRLWPTSERAYVDYSVFWIDIRMMDRQFISDINKNECFFYCTRGSQHAQTSMLFLFILYHLDIHSTFTRHLFMSMSLSLASFSHLLINLFTLYKDRYCQGKPAWLNFNNFVSASIHPSLRL